MNLAELWAKQDEQSLDDQISGLQGLPKIPKKSSGQKKSQAVKGHNLKQDKPKRNGS